MRLHRRELLATAAWLLTAAVEALADRIVPPDPQTPGGKDAGCAVYLDRQLAGPYGTSEGITTGRRSCKAERTRGLNRLVVPAKHIVMTKEEPTGPGMPSFAWQLNNERIAAVATYVRNHWTNPAGAVSPAEVAKQRAKLANRPE